MNRVMFAVRMRTLLHRCVFVMLLATASAGILAGQTALETLRIQAEQGHANAQNNLGVRYDNGQGVPQDYTEAAKWYRKAAEQGVALAQVVLGSMYDFGRGLPQDYIEAVKWYRLAAEQGYAKAQFNLGNMYSRLPGLPNRASSKPLKHPNCSGNSQPASGAA